ncbi:MAG: 50S ribosomal protein L25 [Ignavibacteriales bacterium]|nr:50S ribosomal protein L25 [Ignavibacteriales bacterium]
MSEIAVTAEVRTDIGKKAKLLVRQGKVPGIYYGHGQNNIPIAIGELVLQPLYKSSAASVINLTLDDGSKHMCILRDVQFDPVTDRPVHFDLFGLNENEEVTIEVPVSVKGTAQGVRDGGILQHIIHRLRISCLPKNIPDRIELNVEGLEINKSIHVRDLSIPNVKVLENESSTVVAVVPPTVLKEAEAVPGAVVAEAAAEPEVITKGKKPEDGAEEGAKEGSGGKAPTVGGKAPAAGGKAPAADKK